MNFVTAGLIVAIILLILIVVGSQSYWGDVTLMLLTVGLLVALNFAGTAFILEGQKPSNVTGGGIIDSMKKLAGVFVVDDDTTRESILAYAKSQVEKNKLTPEAEQEVIAIADELSNKLAQVRKLRKRYSGLKSYDSEVSDTNGDADPGDYYDDIIPYKTTGSANEWDNSWEPAYSRFKDAKDDELQKLTGFPNLISAIVEGSVSEILDPYKLEKMNAIVSKLNIDTKDISDDTLIQIAKSF